MRRQRWQPDADGEIRRLAKGAMRQRFADAATLDDPDTRRLTAKHAIASEARARLDALLYLAQAEPPIADTGAGWDADPSLLGVPNGIVDLRTGNLRPARREDRLTLCASVEYRATARSDLWEHALRTIQKLGPIRGVANSRRRDAAHVSDSHRVAEDAKPL